MYHQALAGSPAEEYLKNRGIFPENATVKRFLLGYVAEPLLGHDRYKGWLAIPYLRWSQEHGWIVVNIRFRCLQDHDCKAEGHGKYQSLPGTGTWLYNTNSLLRDTEEIAVIEGELNTIVSELCGVPAIGAPGADTWQPYMRLPLLGYKRVVVVAEGDDPGRRFANTVASTIPGALIVDLPEKHDANSLVLAEGIDSYVGKVRR